MFSAAILMYSQLGGRAIGYRITSWNTGMDTIYQIKVKTGSEVQVTFDDSQDHYWLYKTSGDPHVSGLHSTSTFIHLCGRPICKCWYVNPMQIKHFHCIHTLSIPAAEVLIDFLVC